MIKQKFHTNNKSIWTNTCKYIILHHTWTKENSINWLIKAMTEWKISCHFIIDEKWNIYQIWELTDILWHVWISKYWNDTDLNRCSIGIEIIWPLSNWWFTDFQRESTKLLIKYIVLSCWIKKENILRHKDVCYPIWRKIDLDDIFWNKSFKTFEDYKNSLFSNNNNIMDNTTVNNNTVTTIYTEYHNNILKETWFKPIYDNFDNNQETKELINIAFARFYQRMNEWNKS